MAPIRSLIAPIISRNPWWSQRRIARSSLWLRFQTYQGIVRYVTLSGNGINNHFNFLEVTHPALKVGTPCHQSRKGWLWVPLASTTRLLPDLVATAGPHWLICPWSIGYKFKRKICDHFRCIKLKNTYCEIKLRWMAQIIWWEVNIVSGNALVPSDIKPLHEPMLTHNYATLWLH